MLKNTDRLPPDALPVLAQHVGALDRILGSKLVGVYVHGSAAMGGFNPLRSDLDYLAVVDRRLDARERTQLSAEFLALHGTSGFGKGVEMSIVEARFAGAQFRHPTPYEFHMGSLEQVRHHGRPHEHEHLDPDLASHFTVTRARGICVYGTDTADVFAPIDRRWFYESNYDDVKVAHESIRRDPVYTILNLCRTTCGTHDGAVYSKVEGAVKFLERAGPFESLVRAALDDYRTGATSAYNDIEGGRFVDATLAEIETLMRLNAAS
jgi:hypothetical protein